MSKIKELQRLLKLQAFENQHVVSLNILNVTTKKELRELRELIERDV